MLPSECSRILRLILLSAVAALPMQVQAQTPISVAPEAQVNLGEEALQRDLVRYPAAFFSRFQPITALDMVNQVPGFRLEDDAADTRGFATSAGNVLIDDRRPSTKRDSLNDQLSRIPASSVQRLELIRGQVRNIDMRGQSQVVNLVMREGIPVVVQWELAARETFGFGPVSPQGSISVADSWKGIDFNAGLRGRRSSIGRTGTEIVFDSENAVLETRFDERGNRNEFLVGNVNASSWWGETFWQLNTSLRYSKQRTFTDSIRIDAPGDDREDIFFDDVDREPSVEIGFNLERNLTSALLAKGILLASKSNQDIVSKQTDFNSEGERTLYREASGGLDADELITRFEFDLTAYENHLPQANVERAYNVLDSNLIQTDDTGSGPVIVNVPGANSRVEEIRWDVLIKDIWVLGRVEVDYGLGAEMSTIRQTGDAVLDRDFFFVKPHIVVNYSSADSNQTRIRLAREVAQLDLENFVSATEFLDDDVALGNPNIEPDSTWKLELSQEKRLGTDGVVKVTLFRHWIADTLDLLPLSPTFEAPGNIGDGSRLGMLLESTLPLNWIGLDEAKLDVKFRWQDSNVVDPVTGADRALSIPSLSGGPVVFDVENRYAYTVDYRQDFSRARAAWGFGVWERAQQLRYKVDELEIYDEGTEFRIFVEATRWGNIKVRVDVENILDFADTRERRIFSGERDVTPLETRQYRDRTRGRRLQLKLSGSF